jgi:ABC-type branched-subunit amino acid transport system substrate-binding protein
MTGGPRVGGASARRRDQRLGGLARRHRLLAILLVGVLLLGACGSSSKKSTSSTTPTTTTSSTAPASTGVPQGNDIGITPTQIKVGLVADVQAQIAPGVFQESVNAVKAWATIVNSHGGLAGRQVVIDFCDSKLDPNTTTNCIIQACQNDFALVGTEALALTDTTDITNCKNAQGQALGIANLAGISLNILETCLPVTFLITGNDPTLCTTLGQHPQTYTVPVGDYQYYVANNQGLHGIWIYNGDLAALAPTSIATFQAGANLGIKKDGQGFYTSSAAAPQSALTSLVQDVKRYGSTFALDGVSQGNAILFRREAALQGVNTVKVWGCNTGCYDYELFLQPGGAAVNDSQTLLNTIPFYTEYQSNPSLNALVTQLGGSVNNLNENAVPAYVAALLFQDAVTKAVANGGVLTRQSLFNVLHNQEHSFNGQGIIGTTDVSNHGVSDCIVMVEVKNQQWVRTFPSQTGTFSCNADNVSTIKLDLMK